MYVYDVIKDVQSQPGGDIMVMTILNKLIEVFMPGTPIMPVLQGYNNSVDATIQMLLDNEVDANVVFKMLDFHIQIQ